MIYISHNLGLILETCDRITVMYSGEAVEVGSVGEVFEAMRHPYTRGLFASIPVPGADKNARPLVAIPGQLPLPHQRPPGCNFGPRCSYFVGRRAATPARSRWCRCRSRRLPRLALHPRRRDRLGRAGRRGRRAASRPSRATSCCKVDDLTKHYAIEQGALLLRRRDDAR